MFPREHSKAVQVELLPYREHQLTSGLTIYIGRDGTDNDRTTFEFCKPYELWFHASQCPGSHVVMKYPNKSFQERVININYFISRYGFGIVDFMIEKMEINKTEHQMIYLSEYKG